MKKNEKTKFDPKAFLEWVCITVALFLCTLATTYHGLRPFGVGLFVGLAYVRRNVLFLLPIFLISSVIVAPVWQSVITPVSITLILSLAYLLHRLFKKKVRPWHLLIYVLVALIPSVFIYGTDGETIIWRLVEVALSLGFCLAAVKLCYLIYVKGIRYRLTAIEEICVGVFLAVVALALYKLSIKGLIPALILYGFFAPLSLTMFAERGLVLNLLIGSGCVLLTGDPFPIAYVAVVAIACLFVSPYRYASCALPALIHFLMGALFDFIPAFTIFNTLFILGGGLCSILVPKKVIDKILSDLGQDKGVAVRSIVNRNRLDIYNRLKRMSVILKDMRFALSGGDDLPEARENKNFLAKELASSLCSGCPRRTSCERALGASTSVGLYGLISVAVEKGNVNILDLPSFLIENCNKTQQALSACQTLLSNYSLRKEISDNVLKARILMCEQLEGLSGMIDSFARELKQTVTFDTSREKRLIEELNKVNIIASEAVVFEADGLINGFVVVRAEDENKKSLFKTASKILGPVIADGNPIKSAGSVTVSFVSAPRYDVYYGVYGLPKKGNDASGDTHSAVRLSSDKVMFAVCDGMGSGERARKNSENVISLVESFYKAGIDENSVLSIINKLLSSKGSEEFSALDMCVVDLRNGTADFIKLGGVESVIRRKNGIERVEGGALPIGILENVKPFVCRKTLSGGDTVVLYSDGVSDTIGADGVVRIAEQNATSNPEALAKLIINDVEYVGQKDDSTVLCLRLYERR